VVITFYALGGYVETYRDRREVSKKA
jgi:hypothetical protein